MQLTFFTDYSMRVLIYLGHKESLATVREISESFRVSNNHLVKVVHKLSQLGLIESYKGKSGGIKLAPKTKNMKIGDIVLQIEPHFHIVECFNTQHNACPIIGYCDLENILYEAREQFFKVLNNHTLNDLLISRNRLKKMKILGLA